jgi:hypothetical protein
VPQSSVDDEILAIGHLIGDVDLDHAADDRFRFPRAPEDGEVASWAVDAVRTHDLVHDDHDVAALTQAPQLGFELGSMAHTPVLFSSASPICSNRRSRPTRRLNCAPSVRASECPRSPKGPRPASRPIALDTAFLVRCLITVLTVLKIVNPAFPVLSDEPCSLE